MCLLPLFIPIRDRGEFVSIRGPAPVFLDRFPRWLQLCLTNSKAGGVRGPMESVVPPTLELTFCTGRQKS